MDNLTNDQIVALAEVIGKLKQVKRTGWVLQGIDEAETVAEHTYRTAFLALLLAPEFGLDQLKVVKMALVHDLGEAIIGDIKWEEGMNVVASQEEKHRDEKKAIEEIFSTNERLGEYVTLWNEFTAQETKEARFLKELDKIEMVMQALEYQNEGHSSDKLQQFWDNAAKHLKFGTFEELFKHLSSKREVE